MMSYCHCATGLPPENDNTHCWGDSCYFWYTSANYATARQRCANTSAILFSPNSLEEQLEVGAGGLCVVAFLNA
jgi:hypothetical protein